MTETQKRWTLVAVILGSAVVFLDTSVVNLALKAIGEELPSVAVSRFEGQSYVVSGYFVTLSALLILAGALNDYYGRRRVFGLGLLGFLVTSVACGLAWNLESLIVFRILQGATGAFVVPGSLAIITASFDGEEQGRAYGIWAAASAATSILGPFVGGVLVDAVSWRAAFFVNVPLLLVAIYATRRHVRESRDEEAARFFDWLGSAVVIVAVAGLAFGTIRGQESDWRTPLPFVAIALGALAAFAFPWLMRRRAHPLVPPALFRSRNFAVANLSTFVIYGALYVNIAFLGLFMIGTLGYNEPAAGIAGLPASVLLATLSTRFGRLAARFGPRAFMAAGPAVMGVALLWLARVPPESAPWRFGTGDGASILPPTAYLVDFLPYTLVFGMGLAIMVAPLTTAVMTSIPKRNAGVGSAINNAVSRVGSPLVTALVFVAIVATFYSSIEERVPGVDTRRPDFRAAVAPLNPPERGVDPAILRAAREASTGAFHLSATVAAGLMFVGAAINAVGIRNSPPREPAA